MQDEFLYLRDILNYLAQSNGVYYNYLMSLISDNAKNELALAIEKAEIRIRSRIDKNS